MSTHFCMVSSLSSVAFFHCIFSRAHDHSVLDHSRFKCTKSKVTCKFVQCSQRSICCLVFTLISLTELTHFISFVCTGHAVFFKLRQRNVSICFFLPDFKRQKSCLYLLHLPQCTLAEQLFCNLFPPAQPGGFFVIFPLHSEFLPCHFKYFTRCTYVQL